MSILAKWGLIRRKPTSGHTSADHLRGVGHCPVCVTEVEEFGPGPNGRPGARCPSCGALERHRFLAVLLNALSPELAEAKQILEVAPTPSVSRLIRQRSHGLYLGLDIDPNADGRSVDVVGDLCAAPFPNGSIDMAVCFHVFEHIPNDRTAMGELARILSPSGFAFVQVPWNHSSATDEDPEASIEDRIRRFGQADHVRLYGSDFEERMHASGLHVSRIAVTKILPTNTIKELALRGTVWIVSPAGGAFALRAGEHFEKVVRARLGGST